jgi:3-phosphoshikimate 1-carboxyvinyltransferase
MTVDSFFVQPGGSITGEVRVPGDKSISHRAVMLGAIATGHTKIQNFLEGEDALATLNIFRELGVAIDGPSAGNISIEGVGMRGLRAPGKDLECGNSGTSMRLLCGILVAQDFDCTLTGDDSLRRRPMLRVVEPLAQMGARIECAQAGTPPLRIFGGAALRAINYAMPVASAQVKSAILLAALYARGTTRISEPAATRDHTERMLESFACPVSRAGNEIAIEGNRELRGTDIRIPADFSSAAFFIVAATISSNSDILLRDVGINPTRTGAIEILRSMGADISVLNERTFASEPVADIRVRSARLRGIDIPRELVANAIDEFPVLFVAAANAQGTTTLSGAQELKIKESDRIKVMADGLRALGIEACATADGMEITGGEYGGGEIDSYGDHRVAMSFAIAALRSKQSIMVRDCANVATSFPGFVEVSKQAGLKISER